MPIEPPNPHDVVDTLRSALAQLEELAAIDPGANVRAQGTITLVKEAIVAAEALASASSSPP